MKKLALVAALMLAFGAGALSQDAREPKAYTPSETEWCALYAQAHYGGTQVVPGYTFSIKPRGPGQISVVCNYFVQLGATRADATTFAEQVRDQVRTDLKGRGIEVDARLREVK